MINNIIKNIITTLIYLIIKYDLHPNILNINEIINYILLI